MPDAFFAIAPTDQDHEQNVLRDALRVVKSWELSDAHFDFDSSILLPSMSEEFAELALLVRGNPDCPLSVFGHADPTGEVGYNKILSGRRALAVFALLTHQPDLWTQLFNTPVGRDDWKKDARAARIMQGHITGTAPAPGVPTQAIAQLIPAYMNKLAVDGSGAPFVLKTSAFLGAGADKDGKGAVQGCGESNPLLMFSKAEAAQFALPGQEDARDAANAINRRVTIWLFEKGTVVPPAKWPCPRTKEGIAGCRLRFWSDADTRAKPSENRREMPADRTTLQCRFYDRLDAAARRRPALRPLVLRVLNEQDKPDPNLDFVLLVEGETIKGKTDGDGMLRVKIPSAARKALLELHGEQVPITITKLPSVTRVEGVQVRLFNLGFFSGAADGKSSRELGDAIESFVEDMRLEKKTVLVTRDAADSLMQALLLKEHGS